MTKTIRVGGASGFWGESFVAAPHFRNATQDHALRVAELAVHARQNNLSYADRFCIALAEDEGAELLTAGSGIAQTPSKATIVKFR